MLRADEVIPLAPTPALDAVVMALWTDRDREDYRERAAIRWESGEPDEVAAREALAEVRARRDRRPPPGARDAANWAAVWAWRRACADAARANRAKATAWARASGWGRGEVPSW